MMMNEWHYYRRTEKEVENPFRPDESLYQEVKPIVEAYRHRPFPEPHTRSSPIHAHNRSEEKLNAANSSQHFILEKNRRVAGSNGANTGPENPQNKQINGDGRTTPAAENFVRINSEQKQISMISSTKLSLPPPDKAEVVHVEATKKRCAPCCSLQ